MKNMLPNNQRARRTSSDGAVRLAFVICVFIELAQAAFGSSINSAWYQGVSTPGGSPQVMVTSGPATVSPQDLSGSGGTCPGCPTVPGYSYTGTADALLYGSATPDIIHGYVQSTDNVTDGPDAPPGGLSVSSFADFGFDISDAIHFTSGTLANGTSVSFMITETLDSAISATSAGDCQSGLSYSPNGEATLQMFESDGSFLLGELDHDSCGAGSDAMTLSGTFTSTVGAAFGFETAFDLYSTAGETLPGTSQTTVDATDTGSITIQVLTPNVGFFSDSGADYSGVPEPSTGILGLGGAAFVAFAALRRARAAGGSAESLPRFLKMQ